jgi:hypothetical protein
MDNTMELEKEAEALIKGELDGDHVCAKRHVSKEGLFKRLPGISRDLRGDKITLTKRRNGMANVDMLETALCEPMGHWDATRKSWGQIAAGQTSW